MKTYALLTILLLLMMPAARAQSVELSITMGGDVMLGGNPYDEGDRAFDGLFQDAGGDCGYFFEKLRPVFSADDLTIVNLECTLTERAPVRRRKFLYRANPAYAEAFSAGAIEVCALGNNHAYDFGEKGIKDTAHALSKNGVRACEPERLLRLEIKGARVGVYSCMADQYSAEAILRDLKRARGLCDLLIVSVHWGEQFEYAPSHFQRSLGHDLIEAGADIVFGHHSHVISGVEMYKDKLVAYGLGTLLSTYEDMPDRRAFVLSAQVCLLDGAVEKIEWTPIPIYIPIETERAGQSAPLDGADARRVMELIEDYSPKAIRP